VPTKDLSDFKNLKNLTEAIDKPKVKEILPFVVIREGTIVYASQIFCKQQNIENLKLSEIKIPVTEVFKTDITELTKFSLFDMDNKQISKKKVTMANGKETNIFLKVIQWDNSYAIQIFISEL
jgi:hypothetical protein